jgi:hypothetical protein
MIAHIKKPPSDEDFILKEKENVQISQLSNRTEKAAETP